VRKEIKREIKGLEDRMEKRLDELSEKVRLESEQIRKRERDWETRWEDFKVRVKEVEDGLMEKLEAR